MYKTPHVMFGPLFGVQRPFCDAGARGRDLVKRAKREGFTSFPRSDGRCGAFEEDLKTCMSRGAVQEAG